MNEPTVARTCGDCTLCCKVMAIDEIGKPPGSWCQHCRPGHGCLIYAERPSECRTFKCLWLLDGRYGEEWRPSKSKLVLTASPNRVEVRCDPGFPTAWQKDPFRTEIKRWSVAAQPHNGMVMVIVGPRMIVITPHEDFDLGVVGPQDRIARETRGSRVSVKVVKAADSPFDER